MTQEDSAKSFRLGKEKKKNSEYVLASFRGVSQVGIMTEECLQVTLFSGDSVDLARFRSPKRVWQHCFEQASVTVEKKTNRQKSALLIERIHV